MQGPAIPLSDMRQANVSSTLTLIIHVLIDFAMSDQSRAEGIAGPPIPSGAEGRLIPSGQIRQ